MKKILRRLFGGKNFPHGSEFADASVIALIEQLSRSENKISELSAKIDHMVAQQGHLVQIARRAAIDRIDRSRAGHAGKFGRISTHVSSQTYEDALIAEIVGLIGAGGRRFVEIGVENGLQNTTRFLLEQGWQGLWLEGDPGSAAAARVLFKEFVDDGALTIVEGLVTCKNVNDLVREVGFSTGVDYLSIDVDFNTPHIWEALALPCRFACIEYNASIPPTVDLVVPYDPEGRWDGTNWFGGSLKSLERIGREKGMSLVGCDFTGVNAFFVRGDLLTDKFDPPFTAEAHYEPPRYELIAPSGHPPAHRARRWCSPVSSSMTPTEKGHGERSSNDHRLGEG